MNCENTLELLPWWVNGTLDEAERRQVEEHLASCPSCRQELENTKVAARIHAAHPTAGELYDFAAGEAAKPLDRALIERHVASCASCSEELALIRESQSLLAAEPAARLVVHNKPEPDQGVVVRGPWRPKDWVRYAVAAGLAAAVLAPILVSTVSRSRSESTTMAGRVLDLEMDVVRGGDDETPVEALPTVAHNSQRTTLNLRSKAWEGHSHVAVRLTDASGKTALDQTVMVDHRVGVVQLPLEVDKLPVGVALVSVYSTDGHLLVETELNVTP